MAMERESNPQAGERDDYGFLKLKDAMACVNQKIYLVGVLLEFGFPQKNQGNRIIDESYSQFGILVNCFAENAEQLPVIASQGDIIQLSHVVMKTHERGAYALFNEKFSSFALYDGKDTKDYTPYQLSEKFRNRELDKKFTADLRRWFTEFEVVPDGKVRYYIEDIKMNVRLNMTCKILHKHEVAKNEWIIYLWDGTDIPENSVESRDYDDGHVPGCGFALPSPIAEIDDVDVPFVTLTEVLFSSQATAWFELWPQFRAKPRTSSPQKGYIGSGSLSKIQLLEFMHSGTRKMGYEHGESKGYPSHDILQRKMNQLLGLDKDYDGKGTEYTTRNPPLIQCCLKTYYLDEDDIWETWCCRIFGTTLVGLD